MQVFTTILLAHTLRSTLDVIEETPEVPQDHPGLVEFKSALLQEIAKLERRSYPSQRDAA